METSTKQKWLALGLSLMIMFLLTFTAKAQSSVRGNMLSLGGSPQYMFIPNNPLSSATACTIETWVYPTVGTNWQRIFDFGTGQTNTMFLTSSEGTTNTPRFQILIGSTPHTLVSSTTLALNTWSHIAVTLSGTTATMYINGIQVAQNTAFNFNPANVGSTNQNWLGRSQFPDPYFNGFLDEFRIWNVARTQAQIRENMHLALSGAQTGLVAYYQFNEASGDAVDFVSANNGQLINSASRVASTVSVAQGTSTRLTIPAGASNQNFGNVSINFTTASSPATNDEVVAYRLNETPLNNVSAIGTAASYWVIRQFGTQTFSYNQMNFTLPTGDVIGATDVSTPSNIKLYDRTTNSGGTWGTEVGTGTSANNTTKVVAFNVSPPLTSFGEFAVANLSPAIISSGTLSAVNTTYGTASANTSFSVSGANMTAGITVTAPTGFEVSLSTGSGFAGSITVGSAGTIASTPVYVRLAATATPNTYSGNIVLSSTGATSVNVATVASTVSAKGLTITGVTANNKPFDGNTNATLSGTATLNGIVGSDNVTLSGTPVATFASSAVGTGIAVSVTGYTLGGTAAGNYTLSQPTGLTANITAVASAVRGNMLSLGGSSQYMYIPNNPLSSATACTIETWVYPNAATNWMRIFDFGSGQTNTMFLTSSEGTTNTPRFQILIGSTPYTLVSSTALALNTWSHIAVTLSGTTATMYINGVQVAQNTAFNFNPANVGVTANNWLGRSQFPDPYFIGSLDEFRIWNVARTQAQIRSTMHLTLSGGESGLVGYYQFNEASGDAVDFVSANNGQLINSASRVASTVSVGKGVSKTVSVTSVGAGSEVSLATTNMEIDFSAGSNNPNGEIVVSQITGETPYQNTTTPNATTSCYWVVRNFGTNTGLAFDNILFQIPSGNVILTADETLPTNLKLYHRSVNAGGTWTQVADANSASNTTKQINFDAPSNTSFSEFIIGSTSGALPITLTRFAGERVNGGTGFAGGQANGGTEEPTEEVRLTWETASEINNKGFEVEMSENGLTYEKIAFIEGAGSSTTPKNYQLTTINQNDGYYRLKQLDFDGSFSYSPVVFVEGLAGKVVVYPNPNNGAFTVKSQSPLTPEGGKVRLFNAQGVESPLTPEGGIYKVRADLPTGVYFLHTTVAGKAKITKVIVQH